MSNYRVRETGGVHTQGEIRQMNPNVSLPRVWTQATLDGLGVDPVLEGSKPEAGEYEVVVKDTVTQVGGNWTQTYKTVPMFTATDDATVEEQIAEYEANQLAQKRQSLSATNENLRLQLDQIGVYGVMSAAVATLDAKAEYEGVDVTPYAIHWGYATTINRMDEWVTEVAQAAGITDEQLDDLFEAASGVNTES
jgi:hypothetical protein